MAAQEFVQSVITPTKKVRVDVDSVTAGTPRTLTVPDIDVQVGSVVAGTNRRGTKYTAANVLGAQPKVQTLTDTASISWDVDNGYTATVTLAGNRTLSISNMEDGDTAILRIVQDATGSRTLTMTGVQWAGGTAPTLSTVGTSVDIVSFVKIGGTVYGSIGKAFA